jgi:hypothetical protein
MTPTPNMGQLTGTGMCQVPSDFGNPVCRATDVNSGGGYSYFYTGVFTGNYTVTTTGADYTSAWSCGANCSSPNLAFIVMTFSGCCYGALAVDTSKPTFPMAASALVPGFQVAGAAFAWSRTNPKLLYHMVTGTGALESYTFTNATTAPTANGTIFDFKNCPGSGITASNVTWQGDMGITAADDAIGLSASIGGAQDTGFLVLWYQLSSGKCQVYHTDTATITGTVGLTGSATLADTYKVHDTNIGPGGWIQIADTYLGELSGYCNGISNTNFNHFWHTGTLTVTCMDSATNGTGHNVAGYNKEWNTNSFPTAWVRTFATPGTNAPWGGTEPSPCCSQVTNAHQSWPQPGTGDTGMIFTTTTTVGNALGTSPTFTSPLVDETFGQTMDGTNTWRRFFHCYIDDTNSNFYDNSCIGSVSQDGRFIIWTSDWLETLGATPRIDTFIGALAPNSTSFLYDVGGQDDSLTGWQYPTPCLGPACAGGTGTPTAYFQTVGNASPSLDGGAMKVGFTAPNLSGGQTTNVLWPFKAGTHNIATSMIGTYSIYVPSTSLIAALEFDQFIFSGGTRFMFGYECDIGGNWRIWDQFSGSWQSTGFSTPCNLTAGSWHTVQLRNHRVIGETVCSGHPCEYYDNLIVDGVAFGVLATQSSGTSADPDNTGFQFQIDMNATGGSSSVSLDRLSLTIQ